MPQQAAGRAGKRNVAKAKQVKREAYISPTTGKTVAARDTGPACQCKRKCYDAFRKPIFFLKQFKAARRSLGRSLSRRLASRVSAVSAARRSLARSLSRSQR